MIDLKLHYIFIIIYSFCCEVVELLSLSLGSKAYFRQAARCIGGKARKYDRASLYRG
jgi:hypothetical protein